MLILRISLLLQLLLPEKQTARVIWMTALRQLVDTLQQLPIPNFVYQSYDVFPGARQRLREGFISQELQ